MKTELGHGLQTNADQEGRTYVIGEAEQEQVAVVHLIILLTQPSVAQTESVMYVLVTTKTKLR